jgi:hypothetical protein
MEKYDYVPRRRHNFTGYLALKATQFNNSTKLNLNKMNNNSSIHGCFKLYAFAMINLKNMKCYFNYRNLSLSWDNFICFLFFDFLYSII